MKDLIEEVKASMQSNRQRIMLTGFAIGWGMFILVTLLGSAGGVQKGIYKGANLDMSQLIALTTGKTSIPWNGMMQMHCIISISIMSSMCIPHSARPCRLSAGASM